MKRAAFDDSADLATAIPHTPTRRIRTNYFCAANGCPNTGTIDDKGEDNPGRCFWHWQAPRKDWDAITNRIRHDPSMLNHGDVPVTRSKHTDDAREQSRNGPCGIRNAVTGGEL